MIASRISFPFFFFFPVVSLIYFLLFSSCYNEVCRQNNSEWEEGGEVRKRCIFCKKLFYPDPRQKGMQKTCGSDICKKKRKQKNAKSWREKNPGYDTSEYRRARHKNRRAYKRQYWATHPDYRKRHAEYMRRWRGMRKVPEDRVRDPYPVIAFNYCKQSTYLEITGVRVPYPDIASINNISKNLASNYSREVRKSR